MLTELISILLIGALLAWISESLQLQLPKWIAIATLLSAFYPLRQLLMELDTGSMQVWLVNESIEWIPRFNIRFHLALDGLSLLLVLLTLLMGLIAVLAAWKEISYKPGFFYFNLLCSLAGVIGVFCALDLFLFFVFWEVMLVPMYLLIAVWGYENRRYAAMKFFLFTQAGGLIMLLSICALVLLHYQNSGEITFNYFALMQHQLSEQAAFWVMLGFFIAFVIKLPIVPFHNWLPDAHTEAPTAVSVILAAVLLKTGGYGLLRFVLPLFPDASVEIAPVVMAIAAISIIYGALMAFSQQDLKRLVAYSSVSHMGFVLLGCYAFTAQAWQGAVLQMLAHGVSTAALFALVGAIQYRYHTRDLAQLGGLWQCLPKLSGMLLFFVVASLGMPGLGNFVAEFLVLVGSFSTYPKLTMMAATGLILAAIYSLKIAHQTLFGTLKLQPSIDLDRREVLMMFSMVVLLIWLGLHPQPIIDLAQQSLNQLSIGAKL
ncbi:MAG: NADH-quinone oxidoreductase subunit M [Pseudomonadales bacterium]|nr:NADH-quinone oxidoreductase subunit M [Pseudomonadales bacterium]NRA16534.1 NADH-quinone oxidoreductase subunit M [Oceanospirillaceae bacterium]